MKALTKGIIIALCLAPALSMAQNNFTLTAQMAPTAKVVKAYLFYYFDGDADKRVEDSALVVNNAFQFTGKLDGPAYAYLFLDHNGDGIEKLMLKSRNKERIDDKSFYFDKGNITLVMIDSAAKSKISDSKINDEYEVYAAAVYTLFKKKMNAINAEYAAASEAQQADTSFTHKIGAEKDTAWEETIPLTEKYIKEHPGSFFSLSGLKEMPKSVDLTKREFLFNSLSDSLKKSDAGIALVKKLETEQRTAIGAMAADFTQNDVNDKPVKLSHFRGKYVLLDFWASWCGPCRGENPNVLKAYQAYKDKDFTVLSVSLDNKKEAWLKAIADDKLTWTHVSDLKGWNNEVSAMYGVLSIPANFLIDPQGKIVAKNLRGEDLDKKLAEVLN
jgi:peroxiredoxin